MGQHRDRAMDNQSNRERQRCMRDESRRSSIRVHENEGSPQLTRHYRSSTNTTTNNANLSSGIENEGDSGGWMDFGSRNDALDYMSLNQASVPHVAATNRVLVGNQEGEREESGRTEGTSVDEVQYQFTDVDSERSSSSTSVESGGELEEEIQQLSQQEREPGRGRRDGAEVEHHSNPEVEMEDIMDVAEEQEVLTALPSQNRNG